VGGTDSKFCAPSVGGFVVGGMGVSPLPGGFGFSSVPGGFIGFGGITSPLASIRTS